MKDFFAERPVKVAHGRDTSGLMPEEYGSGFMDNLREWFGPAPRDPGGAMGSLRGADAPGIRVEWQPFYKSFFRNVRDLIKPPKLPELKVTSKPIKVRDIWSKDENFSVSQVVSIVLHGGLAALLIIPFYKGFVAPVKANTTMHTLVTPLDVSPYAAKLPAAAKKAGGGGGGGEHNPLQATRGKLPKFSMQAQLAPPALPRNPNPALQVTPTLIGPDALHIPSPNMANWGDPLSKLVNDSNGPGSGGGMGSGTGGGIGSGSGGG
ncbi:MAG: hypothetical protein ACRD5L_04060, partial [Bryobacteraceae bacterium]